MPTSNFVYSNHPLKKKKKHFSTKIKHGIHQWWVWTTPSSLMIKNVVLSLLDIDILFINNLFFVFFCFVHLFWVINIHYFTFVANRAG